MTKKDSWIQLKHGFSINIPSDLHQIASFIFMEQESWMEVDVQFVETLAPYLSTSVDVGANYGFYSLLMANSGSKDIRIYSIEPNSNTSSHLRRSIRDGKFNVISVHEIAFSNFEGQATLTNSSNPELSELNLECDSDQPETKVCKLDNWLKKLGNFQVDFLKLDAEGSEMSILEGGKSFFDLQDPLIMFELKHGQKVQTELIDGFKVMGYEIFQYWPGVNCLVPVDTSDSTTFDPMRLNLYAVKISRQKILNDYGLLVRKFDNTPTTIPQALFKTSFHEKLELSSENLSKWYESSDSLSKKIFDAVAIYEDESVDLQSRVSALYRASRLVASVRISEELNISDSFSLIRVSKDLGNYGYAANVALKLLQRIQAGERIIIEEPFVSLDLDSEQKLGFYSLEKWLPLVLIETLELCSTFSGIFSAELSLNRCDVLDRFGFLNPLLNRRYILLKKLVRGQFSPLTKDSLSCSLNKKFWQNSV
ncbi:MAG: FkbM family methyltransferase [bacterium]|nr:FkbM family methyltransferase [bacterium]